MFCEALIKNPKRISIFISSSIGDTVVYIPALQMLRAMFPDSIICLICNELALELYKQFNFVDRYSIFTGPNQKFISELNGDNLNYLTAQELASLGQDAYPSIHTSQQECWGTTDILIMTERNRRIIKSALQSDCKQVLTFCYTRSIYTARLPFISYYRRYSYHESFAVQFLLKTLDRKKYKSSFELCDFKKSILKATPEARAEINNFLSSIGFNLREANSVTGLIEHYSESTADQKLNSTNNQDIDNNRKYSRLIVINPHGASSFLNGFCYAPEYYIKIARDLAKEYPPILFVISSFGEQSYHKEEFNDTNLKLYINQDGLMNVIALLEQCDLVISPSTGPAHIADNLGKDVIGAFPYYDKIRWAANGLMKLAAKQNKPTIAPHKFVMHPIKMKLTNGIDSDFVKFEAMCKSFIKDNF